MKAAQTTWHQQLVENIYAINRRLKESKDISPKQLCELWGGFDYTDLDDGKVIFSFRVNDFEFTVAHGPGGWIMIGEVKLWLEQEKFKPFELMAINLIQFIKDNKLKLD